MRIKRYKQFKKYILKKTNKNVSEYKIMEKYLLHIHGITLEVLLKDIEEEVK